MISRDIELAVKLCGERAGLNVDPEKHYLLENRLAPVARREGFSSIEELMGAVRNRGDERLTWAVVEAMWPAETSFFRDPAAFELMASDVLPKLAQRAEKAPLRIWSAASGTGQEVYSLAMLLSEQTSFSTAELFASDLCERRLEKAQSGLFSQFEVQRGLSAHRLVRHFESTDEGFKLSPRIRQTVRWRRVNLIEDIARLGQFDLVVCRNLAQHLSETARERLFANLTSALAPGGCLVLAAGESAPGLSCAAERPGFHFHPGGQRAAA